MSDSINALIGAQRNASLNDRIANPPSINPLAGIQAGADAAKTVVGVRQLAAQNAWGQALAGATDQNTGVVDYPNALKTFSSSPYASYGMPAAVASASPMQNDQVNRGHYLLGVYQGLIGALPDNATRDQINAALDKGQALGLSPTDIATERQSIPTNDADLPGFVQQLRLSGSSGVDQANRQQTMGMAPADYYRIVDVQLGGGQTIQVPAGQAGLILGANPRLRALNPNLGGPGGAGAAPPPGGTVTNANFGANAGRYGAPAPAPAAQANAPPPAPSTQAPPSTPVWARPPPPPVQGGAAGGLGVPATPGYLASQNATAAASTQAATGLQSQVSAAKDIEPILADMEAQLGTKGFTPGVGATTMSSVRQLMQRVGLVPEEPGPGVNLADPQAAQELFAKNAARLQIAQMGALGNPTDARQELSESTNPGMLISKYGNTGIIHMLQGNQQAIRAMGDAWAQAQAAGWTPDRFNEWQTQRFLSSDKATGGRFDPRVFWFANEGSLPAQRDYAAKMPPAQVQQFRANLQYAKNNGWVTLGKDGSVQPSAPAAQ